MSTQANPVAQLAKMYQLIEGELRAKDLSIAELNEVPDIKATRKSLWQVRDIVRTLNRQGHLMSEGVGRAVKYRWNKASEPFMLPTKLAKKAAKAPSEVKVTKVEKAPTPAKEFELVFDNTLIIVGRNAVTGRIRISIEELGNG